MTLTVSVVRSAMTSSSWMVTLPCSSSRCSRQEEMWVSMTLRSARRDSACSRLVTPRSLSCDTTSWWAFTASFPKVMTSEVGEIRTRQASPISMTSSSSTRRWFVAPIGTSRSVPSMRSETPSARCSMANWGLAINALSRARSSALTAFLSADSASLVTFSVSRRCCSAVMRLLSSWILSSCCRALVDSSLTRAAVRVCRA